MCLLLAGCGPCRHLPTAQRDSVFVHLTDSVTVRDSVYIDRERIVREKGDTVWIRERVVKYRDRWRERVKTDTLWREREKEVPVEVERKPTKWETFWEMFGKIFAGLLGLAAVVVLVRRFIVHR